METPPGNMYSSGEIRDSRSSTRLA